MNYACYGNRSSISTLLPHIHTCVHTHIYLYLYMFVCVCYFTKLAPAFYFLLLRLILYLCAAKRRYSVVMIDELDWGLECWLMGILKMFARKCIYLPLVASSKYCKINTYIYIIILKKLFQKVYTIWWLNSEPLN